MEMAPAMAISLTGSVWTLISSQTEDRCDATMLLATELASSIKQLYLPLRLSLSWCQSIQPADRSDVAA